VTVVPNRDIDAQYLKDACDRVLCWARLARCLAELENCARGYGPERNEPESNPNGIRQIRDSVGVGRERFVDCSEGTAKDSYKAHGTE
jgi:hypothetical protein